MADQPTQEQIAQWHRWFAIECNNRAWSLAAQTARTPDDDREMRDSAHAAAYHWGKIGAPINTARADVALAHVYALLGDGAHALQSARQSLDFFTQNESADWDIAFAHAEMAFAAAVNRDAALHAHHYTRARELGAAIKQDADRKIFLDELAKIPSQV
ncbi:MAG: hypothetical protein HZC40_05660 [Chloroflexi bacterium]|nr:hypothetical protein [Chloroflexota bacterium]